MLASHICVPFDRQVSSERMTGDYWTTVLSHAAFSCLLVVLLSVLCCEIVRPSCCLQKKCGDDALTKGRVVFVCWMQVTVDRPDVAGRIAILQVHARGKVLSKDVDLDKIARRTPGFTGKW